MENQSLSPALFFLRFKGKGEIHALIYLRDILREEGYYGNL